MSNLKIGEKIKAKRRERELTQEELATILGVTKAAVSKWENGESYPDITMLPKIAQLFYTSMDELFDYTPEYKPLKITNEYHFGLTYDDVDKRIFDHGSVKKCVLEKCGHIVNDVVENTWQVQVHFVSTEEDFPYTLQKYIKPGLLWDGYSIRLADGKVIDDDKPNKHYVCSQKVWEYKNTDYKYLRQMLKEQVDMGYIDEDDI